MDNNRNVGFFGSTEATAGKAEGQQPALSTEAAATFISTVFTYMTGGLAISAVLAYVFGTNEGLTAMIIAQEGGLTALGWLVTLSPLAFVLVMSFGMQKLSATTLLLMFMVFAAAMGMSLSTIFVTYSAGTIFKTFGVTAITFAIMAVLGYTTKTDLTKFGSLLMMALFGIIIAMVVNWFMASPMLDYLISIIGVFIFTGLTAYDTQRLKRIGGGQEYGPENTNKLAVMGSLSLYLNFVNLFLFLLRLFGGGRN